MTSERPEVWINFAESLDGKIAPAPALRGARFVMSRGDHDLRRMKRIRAGADAIVIGAGNLRDDDPSLSLADEERAARRSDGRAEPWRVVVTTRGAGVTTERRIFDPGRGGPTLVAHAASMPEETRAELAPHARLVAMGDARVDVARLLAYLRKELGVRVVLCEGGGVLVAELLAIQAVDVVFLTLAPRILGGADAPTMVAGPGLPDATSPDARLQSCEQVGDELFLRYALTWPTRG